MVSNIPLPFLIFGLFVLGIFFLSTTLWLTVAYLVASKDPFLPKPETPTDKPWGLFDILLTILALYAMQIVGYQAGLWGGLFKPLGVNKSADLYTMSYLSSMQILVAFLITGWIALRCNIRPALVGWSVNRFGRDIVYGIGAFILVAPPVYILMVIVSMYFGKEYEHPILQMVNGNRMLLIPAIWMAVFVAPLTEEFAFRVLLQGYLQSMGRGGLSLMTLWLGRPKSDASSIRPANKIEGSTESVEIPSESSSRQEQGEPYWPIFVSGLIFGLMHYDYGMSWIPLTILGFVLGLLYRMTNRIWPSFVVHFLLNLISMIGFSLSVIYGDPTKIPLAQ